MSETELIKGKLSPLKMGNENIESMCKKLCKNHRITGETDEGYSYKDLLRDELYDKYIVFREKIYKVVSKENLIYEDIFDATLNEDESVDFLLKYYNGGCGFGEAIEAAIEGIEQ